MIDPELRLLVAEWNQKLSQVGLSENLPKQGFDPTNSHEMDTLDYVFYCGLVTESGRPVEDIIIGIETLSEQGVRG